MLSIILTPCQGSLKSKAKQNMGFLIDYGSEILHGLVSWGRHFETMFEVSETLHITSDGLGICFIVTLETHET